MLTCECTIGMSPGGESILIYQVPPAPTDLLPGTYTFLCQSEDRSLSGRQIQFRWTGTEWQRKKTGGQDGSPRRDGWNSALESWLNKPFVVTKKERKTSIFSKGTSGRLCGQMVVARRGIQPGQSLQFGMSLKNCGGRDDLEKVTVALVQKTTSYLREGKKESVRTLVDNEKFLREEEAKSGREICWSSELYMKDDLTPSLTREWRCLGSLEISYVIQFTVREKDGTVVLRGEAPVVVGRRESCQ